MPPLFEVSDALIAATRNAIHMSGAFVMHVPIMFFFGVNINLRVNVTQVVLQPDDTPVYRLHVLMRRALRAQPLEIVSLFEVHATERDLVKLYTRANADIELHAPCEGCAVNVIYATEGFCRDCQPLRFILSPPSDDLCVICLEPLRGCLVQFPECRHRIHTRCARIQPQRCPSRCSAAVLNAHVGLDDPVSSDSDSDE